MPLQNNDNFNIPLSPDAVLFQNFSKKRELKFDRKISNWSEKWGNESNIFKNNGF